MLPISGSNERNPPNRAEQFGDTLGRQINKYWLYRALRSETLHMCEVFVPAWRGPTSRVAPGLLQEGVEDCGESSVFCKDGSRVRILSRLTQAILERFA